VFGRQVNARVVGNPERLRQFLVAKFDLDRIIARIYAETKVRKTATESTTAGTAGSTFAAWTTRATGRDRRPRSHIPNITVDAGNGRALLGTTAAKTEAASAATTTAQPRPHR